MYLTCRTCATHKTTHATSLHFLLLYCKQHSCIPFLSAPPPPFTPFLSHPCLLHICVEYEAYQDGLKVVRPIVLISEGTVAWCHLRPRGYSI